MTIRELTADPITKIIGEWGQVGLNVLEADFAECTANIKTIEDMIEQKHKYGFLILILGKEQ